MKVALVRQILLMEDYADYQVTRALVPNSRKSAFKAMKKRQPWLKKTKVTHYGKGGALCFGVKEKKGWKFYYQYVTPDRKQKFSVHSW